MPRTQPIWPAISTAIWAVLFGGLNLYWTFGGRWLTDRLGISIQDSITENDQQLMIANTVGGVGKLGLGVAAVVTLFPIVRRIPRWLVSLVLIGSGALLLVYGLANWSIVTSAMLGFIDTPSSIGEDALPWYFWLWEPLWMLGGVLLLFTWWAWRQATQMQARSDDLDGISS